MSCTGAEDPSALPEKGKRGRPRKAVTNAKEAANGKGSRAGNEQSSRQRASVLKGLGSMLRWHFDVPPEEVGSETGVAPLGSMVRWHFDAPSEGTVAPFQAAYKKRKRRSAKELEEAGIEQGHCDVDGCTASATYRWPGQKLTRCKDHTEPGMQRKSRIPCQAEGCTTTATLGYPGPKGLAYDRAALTHCKKHAKPGMVNLINRRCAAEGCFLLPSQGWPNGKVTHCVKHALPGMERTYKQLCNTEGCQKRPAYGFPGDAKYSKCADHAEAGMVLLRGPRCTECGATAYYGTGTQMSKATRCREHREPWMYNIAAARCRVEGCSTEASFGMPGMTRPVRCKAHMEKGMLDVRNARRYCQADGCTTSANFGLRGGIPSHCSAHKLPAEVSLKPCRCTADGCETAARFGWAGQHPKTCSKHKQEGMVSVIVHTCVIMHTCKVPGCSNKGTYRAAGAKKEWYCAEHEAPGMVCKYRECNEWGCGATASHGFTVDRVPLMCGNHVLAGMVNLSAAKATG